MESYTTSVMPPQDPMSKFNNNCTSPSSSSSSGLVSSAHGPAPHARHNSHGAISHHHFPGNKNHVVVGSGQAQAQTSFQSNGMRASEQQPANNTANGSPTTAATTQQQKPHSYQSASPPGESAQPSPYHPHKQQQQQHIPRPLQQNQQPQRSQPHQHPIPEHHHIQYPSYKDPSNPYPTTNGHNGMLNKANGTTSNSNSSSNNSNGMVRSHTHSLSHPHLQFAPFQEQNQKQQYQQPQQQHFNGGFQQGPPPQQPHHSPFRPPGSHIPHSMSMPMKPPTPSRMHHLQFGPGGPPSHDRRGSLPGSGYPHPLHHHLQHHHDMDTTMDSDGSSGGDSGDECFGGGGGGGLTQGAQWTRQEDILLREAVVKFNGKAWKRIAEYCFPDGSRDKDQCLQRWRMISKPRSIKGPWTPEEDRQLRMLVNELGAEKWVLIASRLGSRTGKQCRERWHNHLDPKIDKSPFTAKEDELIFKLFAQFGSKWAEMSKLMPGRPDNAIKNHFNTSMQRKRRRLSLQDPSELQMKGEHGPSNGAVSPPLASPTSATSPSVTRHNRFDPYERRHSMPSLEFSPKAYNHHHHPHHHHSGSRDYSGEGTAGGHPYHQPPPPPHHNSHHHHQQLHQQQPQHPHQQQQQQQHPNGPGQGPYPRTIPTPPKTPDTKGPLKFAASMSRSISLGSSDRMGMPAPGGNANGGHSHHHQHSHSLSHNGPVRPNLPGISSLHSPPPPPPPPHSGSNNHSHHLYSTSTMAAMVPPSSSTTASLASPSSSSSTPPSAVLMARSSSAMGISNETPSPFYNRNPRDAPFNPNQQQQQQSMRSGFPRPNNMARHDSAGGSSGRFVRGHEHHRSLDIDPFSALAELANLADQQRQAPGSGSPTSNGNKAVMTTTSNHHGATTVVVQSSEENDEYNGRQQHHQLHQRRGSQGGSGGESMSRSGSGSSIDGPDVEDVEDAVIKTMIERPLVHTPAPTQGPPAPGPLARRFSTLGHVKEEEHGEEGEEQHQQHQHSYHIDPRINNTNNGPSQGTLGHSKSYSGHALSSNSSRDLSSSMTGYRSKRLSVDFSILSDPASDGDEDDEDMVVDGADGGSRYYQQQQSHYNQQQQHQHYRYPAHKQQQEGSSSSSPTSPGPSAAYLSMRRGSVRELMAIDHLCLSSEEVERC